MQIIVFYVTNHNLYLLYFAVTKGPNIFKVTGRLFVARGHHRSLVQGSQLYEVSLLPQLIPVVKSEDEVAGTRKRCQITPYLVKELN